MDGVSRPSHMQQLYSICKAPKKIWRVFPNGMHNDTIAEPYFFDFVLEYVQDVLGGQKMNPSL